MHHAGRNGTDGGRRLASLQRTDNLSGTPGLEHIESELATDTARVSYRFGGNFGFFSELGQLAEGPLFAAAQVAQGHFIFIFPRYAPPALVQHCQFSTRSLALLASLIYSVRQRFYAVTLLVFALLLVGCSTPQATVGTKSRPFKFGEDTFAYANELVWQYETDPATGKMTHHTQSPKPDYTHHCFVLALAARQFFDNAQFDAAAQSVDEKQYRRLIDKVVKT